MFLSLKYVVFYVATGGVTGYIAKGDKKIAYIGMGLAALMGSTFGLSYAIVSAIEFGIGFLLGKQLIKTNDE